MFPLKSSFNFPIFQCSIYLYVSPFILIVEERMLVVQFCLGGWGDKSQLRSIQRRGFIGGTP